MGARVLTVYGGRAYEPQLEALAAGVDVVVGTPGRLLDLANRKNLDLSQSARSYSTRRTRCSTSASCRTSSDCAAHPRRPADHAVLRDHARRVVTLARRHLRQPTNIRAEGLDESAPPPLTTQYVYRTHHLDKIEVLARSCRRRTAASPWSSARPSAPRQVRRAHRAWLRRRDRSRRPRPGPARARTARLPHRQGGRPGGHRRGRPRHRRGRRDARDQHECPDDAMAYVHRIGRTGRAGQTGVAVTFVDWGDMHRW